MIALNEQFHHHGTKTQSRCRCGGESTMTPTLNVVVQASSPATAMANAIAAAASAAPGATLAGLVGYRTSEYDYENRATKTSVLSSLQSEMGEANGDATSP